MAFFAAACAFLCAQPAQAASYTLATQFNFDGTKHGANPISDLAADSQGTLYGTTSNGGNGGHGTVFQFVPSTGTLTTLVKFAGGNGSNPYGGVYLDGQGHLFGTTYTGGSSHDGTLYQVTLSSHTLTTRVTFKGSNGTLPLGNLSTDGQGNLYGVTQAGGANGFGTIFRYNMSTHALTTLFSFTNLSGTMPYAGVTPDGMGNLYGTTYLGGSSTNVGTLYALNITTRALTVLHVFDKANGGHPRASLTLDSGSFYGTTETGGTGSNGVLFQYTPSTTTFTVLHKFVNSDGSAPYAGVIVGSDGNLYGTTQAGGGGDNEDGTVYEYNTGSGALSTLISFDGVHESQPFGTVLEDSTGNFYGTTAFSGGHNDGALYELSPVP